MFHMYKITYESHIVKVSIQLKHFWPFYRQIWTINARKQCQKNKVCLHAGTSPIKTMRFFKAAGDSRHVSWTIIYKWHKWLKRERLIFWMTKELPIHPGSCTYIILSPEVALRKWMRFNICITMNSDIQETKFRILFIQHLSNLK